MKNEQESISNVGNRILTILEEKKTNINQFCKIAEWSRTKFYKLLRQNCENYKKADLALICTLLGIIPEEIGFKSDIFSTPFNQNFSDTELHSFNIFSECNGKEDHQAYLDKYFELVHHFLITPLDTSLTILDYCAKEKGLENKYDLKYFNKKNKEYYKELEKKLEGFKLQNKPFIYERFSQLPLDVERYTEANEKEFGNRRDLNFSIAVRIIIELMYDETFKHVWKCFNNFNNYFKLYVLKLPIRFFNIYIANNNCVISEYDRCNLDRVIFPDLIFAEKDLSPYSHKNNVIKDYIKSHKIDLEKLKKSKTSRKQAFEVDKKLFKESVLEQYDYLNRSSKSCKYDLASMKNKQVTETELKEKELEYEYWKKRVKKFKRKKEILLNYNK